MNVIFKLLNVFFCLFLFGCVQHHALQKPENPSNKLYGTKKEEGEVIVHEAMVSSLPLRSKNCMKDADNFTATHYKPNNGVSDAASVMPFSHSLDSIFYGELPLSPGDMVALQIENGDGFNGNYVVDASGFLRIPYLRPIQVRGLPLSIIREKLELSLIKAELFRPTTSLVSLSIVQWADIEVMVSGAVFQPGRVRINKKIPQQIFDERIRAMGDFSSERMLSEAIRAASGARPDAKMDQIILIRNGWQIQVNFSGIFTGELVQDIALVAGDRVIIPSTGCFQSALVRPTSVTPKGMRVFMSNLIDSAENNSSAAVGKFSSSMPYGSRLLQVAVSANCVGGKQWTNAPRKILLASKNPLTGQIQVVNRSVEKLMRQAHIEEINPFIMPEDAIACYDSDVTNIRDVARGLVEIISPLKLL